MTLQFLDAHPLQNPIRLRLLPLQLPCHLVLPLLILPPGHLLQMHLIRPIRNPQRPDLRPHIRQRRILTYAHPAIRLHRAINHRQRHTRDQDLCFGDLPERRLGIRAVDLDRCVQDDQSRGVDLESRLGDPLQQHAMRRQRLAKRLFPLVIDPRDQPFQRPLRRANGAHRVVDPSRPQSPLNDLKSLPLTQHHRVRILDPHILEADMPMPVRRIIIPVNMQHPMHGNPLRIRRHKHNRLLLIRIALLRRRLPHHDVDLASVVPGAGGPPFRPVQDPLVAFLAHRQLDVRRVGGGDVRLRH